MVRKKSVKIPSMTSNAARKAIIDYVSKIEPGLFIVEVGVWLGACTESIAKGLLKHGKINTIHCFDRFRAGQSEVEKAKKFGVKLKSKRDTLPLFKHYMKKYVNAGVKIKPHKMSINSIKWNLGKIGLYIDDAAKRKDNFDHVMKTFERWFVAGKTIVLLMDFYFYEKRNDDPGLKYQQEYIEKSGKYTFLERLPEGVAAAYRYDGQK